MDRHTIIFATDKRQENLAMLLDGEKRNFVWEEKVECEGVCEKIYVLPTPVSKLDKNPKMKEKLKQELMHEVKNVCAPTRVFGGAFSTEWKEFLETQKITYWDFMELPEVVEGNAFITAEGTVAEMLLNGCKSICGQHVLVTGYGCCGEKIAKLLSKMGAKVTVVARRKEVRVMARKDGFTAISFEEMPDVMSEISTVVNTVPALVVTEESIRNLPKDALILDIASKPGGTDFAAAKRYGISAKLALGLPGIYTTKSSAMLLKNAIEKYAPSQEKVREDKSWIFQIII